MISSAASEQKDWEKTTIAGVGGKKSILARRRAYVKPPHLRNTEAIVAKLPKDPLKKFCRLGYLFCLCLSSRLRGVSSF